MKHIVTSSLEIVTRDTLIFRISNAMTECPANINITEYIADCLMQDGYCSVIEIHHNQQMTIPGA